MQKLGKEGLEALEEFGYRFVETKTEHETARLQGATTIVLYKNGKLLIQGKEEQKERITQILKKKGYNV